LDKTVIFAHGKESGPSGKKILALARIAESRGLCVSIPDFRGEDDPEKRLARLLDEASSLQGPFVLVGSSMGAYVSLRASGKLQTVGLFLMAPAIDIPGYPVHRPVPGCKNMTIVHAWQDEIIPARTVIEYAEHHKAELHMVKSDHRLSGQVPLLERLFENFLGAIA